MTLKQKSVLISLVSILVLSLSIVAIIYFVILNQYQDIENQRVERNVRRISAILEDRFSQINTKLADWTIWDDTYEFLQDKNPGYSESNLTQESFSTTGVDEAVFLNKNLEVIDSISIIYKDNPTAEKNFPNDLIKHFPKNSELLSIDPETGYNHGVIRTDDGILLFAIRDVYRSDGSGPSAGYVIFARYLDENILNSLKDLTQFEAKLYDYNSQNLPVDYQQAKKVLQDPSNDTYVQILDQNTISGYQIISDIYGTPQAIVRSDINRDIYRQGIYSVFYLAIMIIGMAVITSGLFYFTITKNVLQKVTQIAFDVQNLKPSGEGSRLSLGKTADEVDRLRQDINKMLDSLTQSQTALSLEKQKGDSLTDLINAIVLTLDEAGKVVNINKRGLEMLGYDSKEVIGKNWMENFIPQSKQKEVQAIFQELLKGNANYAKAESEAITKKGKTITIAWNNTFVKDSNGRVISTISIGEDITEEKTAQLKKEASNQEIQRLNELMVNRELRMVELKKELEKHKKHDSK